YLDWLELVYENNKENNIEEIMQLFTYNKQDLILGLRREAEETIDIRGKIDTKAKQSKVDNEILKTLNWKYKYLANSKILAKTSVTKLKELEEEKDIEDLINEARNAKTE